MVSNQRYSKGNEYFYGHGKTYIFKEGTHVWYKLKEGNRYYRGDITGFVDSLVVIGKDTIGVKQFSSIGFLTKKSRFVRHASIPLLTVGSTVMYGGFYLMSQASRAPDALGGFVYMMVGGIVVVAGTIPTFIGIVSLTKSKKKFHLNSDKWKLELVEISSTPVDP